MNRLKISTAGESHGKALVGILSGFLSGIEFDEKEMNSLLNRRRGGAGRSQRQKFESDNVEIVAGVIDNITTGAPIAILIKNNPKSIEKSFDIVTVPRPGHSDYSGIVKYNRDNIWDISERASARRTVIDVALSFFTMSLLKKMGISSSGKILSLGDETLSDNFEKKIELARKNGESLGGSIKIKFENIPIGLGDNFVDEFKLDGQIGTALLSIPGVKGIEIGEAVKQSRLFGSKAHDRFFVRNNVIMRESNLCGGVEGGISNGETLEVTLYMKPIPTISKSRKSIDIFTKKEVNIPTPRADISVLESLIVIAQSKLSMVIVDNMLTKFGGDSFLEFEKNMKNYLNYTEEKYSWKRT